MKKTIMAVASLALSGTAIAHHSFAVFFNTDSKLVKVTGVVRDFQFRNPHGVITLVVPQSDRKSDRKGDSKGGQKGRKEITWRAETNSPSILRRRGWSADSLHVGDKVTLEGWPARDGSNYIRLRSATRSDGQPIGQPVG